MPSSLPRLSTLFLLCLSSLLLPSLSAQPETDSLELKVFMDAELQELFTSVKAVGGSVAFIENGKITYANGFGFANREANLPATPATIYRACSMTKTMTAVAILQLQEQGKLDIDLPVSHYLPELRLTDIDGQPCQASIRDILTHLSGLTGDVMNAMMTQQQVAEDGWQVAYLNGLALSSPANFNQGYSNVGYGLLGHLIARVSGQSYTDYLADHLFQPLGMRTAQVGHPADGLSVGYVDNKATQLDYAGNQAAAAVTASVLDLTTFMHSLMGSSVTDQPILNEKSLALMKQNALLESFLPTVYGYGLGVDVRKCEYVARGEEQVVTFLKHSGNEVAFHGEFGFVPELGIGVAIMTNSNLGFLACDTKELLDLYLKHRYAATLEIDYQLPEHGLSEPTAEEIIGAYNIGPAGMEVQSAEQIKFQMKGVKVKLRRRAGTMKYDVRLRLLGIIPVKIKDVFFEFVKKENRVFLRQVNIARNAPEYLGKRISKPVLPAAWQGLIGQYELTNPIPSHNERFNFAEAKIQLLVRDDWPILSIKTPGMRFEMALTILSDKLAVTGGMGRQAGDQVKVTGPNELTFSGMVLRKLK